MFGSCFRTLAVILFQIFASDSAPPAVIRNENLMHLMAQRTESCAGVNTKFLSVAAIAKRRRVLKGKPLWLTLWRAIPLVSCHGADA